MPYRLIVFCSCFEPLWQYHASDISTAQCLNLFSAAYKCFKTVAAALLVGAYYSGFFAFASSLTFVIDTNHAIHRLVVVVAGFVLH